ncbi:DNA-binding pseudobarrel domain-containing protein [Artemisia annua]|uniref:DNA-binding pseudobarrel domain-containing protein n=1 Tax=Artemisia annua TaxID=35608 RepID=A0A2U1NBE8_ARTAN|nr:DNA-binding pseudobarrel domain-containing protein [Artemisia annua]
MQMGSCGSSEPHQDSLSFFKVIRYPSSPHIALPSAFVETHSKKMSRSPTLKTASGNYSWSVEIKRVGEDYCFANGWENLAKDVKLCERDIVVFWLVDAYTIQVTFFGADGCEKKLPLIKSKNGHDVVDEAMEDEDLSFQKVIRVNTQRYAMVLPRAFVVAAGLEYKTNIKMKDHEGYEWRVGIIVERTFRRIKHSLSSGWSKFRQHCNLADDDVCFFKYDKEEGILNLTHVIKSKRSTTNAVDAVRIEDECSPTDKPSDGAKVSVECESGRELDMAQRKMGRPLLNGGTDVKIKDEWDAEAIAMRKKRRLLEKNEQERERVVRSNQVIYF